MHFSATFLGILVILALAGIAVSVFALIYLFIKDAKSKSIW